MGEFIKDNLPDAVPYFESEGLTLKGKGKWRTTECTFHGGSDSMRVHIDTGAFVCMAGCGAKGGDVLAYHMAVHGPGFVESAKALGAYREDGKPHSGPQRPARIPAKDLLAAVAFELQVCAVVLADALNGCLKDADFDRFHDAAGVVIHVAGVANA